MPKLMRAIGVAAITGFALSASAVGAQASGYGYHDNDARAEIRIEKRIDADRAEFELRKRIDQGDARFELRIKKRVDVDNHHYGYHDIEKRVEIRVEVRGY